MNLSLISDMKINDWSVITEKCLHTHTHTCKPWTDILLAKRGRACSMCYRQRGTLCVKLRTHNLCMTFQHWTEDQTLCTLFSLFFQHTPIYARVGNLQLFARIHKSWTVLVCNVVLGLMVEFRSMSSVDGAYKLTHTHTHTHKSANGNCLSNNPHIYQHCDFISTVRSQTGLWTKTSYPRVRTTF